MTRTRLFLFLLIILVIVGAVVAFILLGQQQQGGTATTTGGTGGDTGQTVTRQTGPTPTPLPTITPIALAELVIAVQDVPRGIPIAPNAVAVVLWPLEAVPNQAYSNIDDVVGKIARTDIFREQPILQNLVVEDLSGLANVGSDAAAILPANRQAIAVPMDRLTSVAYAIQPGDRVDIIVSMLFVDVNEEFQSGEPNVYNLVSVQTGDDNSSVELTIEVPAIRGGFDSRLIPGLGAWPVLVSPSENPRPRLTTQNTIKDALVIYVGNFPYDGRIFQPAPTPTVEPTPDPAANRAATGGAATPVPPTPLPPRPDIITLGVSPQDAVVLTYYVEAGFPITFALRSAASTSQVNTDAVTMDYIMNRFRIQVPDRFNYATEPAIRSIRQISAGNRISLQEGNTAPGSAVGGQ